MPSKRAIVAACRAVQEMTGYSPHWPIRPRDSEEEEAGQTFADLIDVALNAAEPHIVSEVRAEDGRVIPPSPLDGVAIELHDSHCPDLKCETQTMDRYYGDAVTALSAFASWLRREADQDRPKARPRQTLLDLANLIDREVDREDYRKDRDS